MKKTACILLAAAFALTAFSCTLFGQETRKTTLRGNDDIVTKTLSIGNFTQMLTKGMFDITFIQTAPGTEPSAEVTTSSNIAPFVEAVCEDGTLTLSMSDKHRYNVKKIQVTVRAPKLLGVEMRGSGDLVIEDGLVTEAFKAIMKGAGDIVMKDISVAGDASFLVQGAGDVQIDGIDAENVSAEVQGAGGIGLSGIEAEKLSVVIKGAGDATLSGEADTAVLQIKGAGSIDARNLKSDNYDITRAGAGSVKR